MLSQALAVLRFSLLTCLFYMVGTGLLVAAYVIAIRVSGGFLIGISRAGVLLLSGCMWLASVNVAWWLMFQKTIAK